MVRAPDGIEREPTGEASWPSWPGRLVVVWVEADPARHLWRVDLAGERCLFAYQVKAGDTPEGFAFTFGEA